VSDPYIGEMRIFAGNFAPVGWLLCQGQALAISDYDVLYALLGTTYGGDGVSTFNLPNLSSRIPVHPGSNGGTAYTMGQMGGAESVTLTSSQLPVHSHAFGASSGAATANSPSGAVPAVWSDEPFSTAAPTASMATTALGVAGGSQPHDNMPPFLCLNFIIATEGIYPSTS
jgi:microcystin-dependent protein